VDKDLWLKFDNGSLALEIVLFVMFYLGGKIVCPSLVLSPPREKGYN
jgi:hypothetical protein